MPKLIESFFADGANGIRLHGRKWCIEKPRATLLGVHGYSEHSGRYEHVALAFNEKGFNVFWIDLPGHGLSEGKRNSISDFNHYVVAVERLLREAERSESPQPIHLFAHSLGALVATRFIQSSHLARHIQCLSLSGPLFGVHRFSPAMLCLLKFLTSFLPDISLSNKKELNVGVLTSDPEMQKKRLADPLVNDIATFHWFREFLKAKDAAFREVDKIRLPIKIFTAEKECVVDLKAIEEFFALLSFPDKAYINYPGFLHEIVNDRGRAQVISDILDWHITHLS